MSHHGGHHGGHHEPYAHHGHHVDHHQQPAVGYQQMPAQPVYAPAGGVILAHHAEWHNGLFGCYDDMETCCYSLCCGPCALASAKSKTDHSPWYPNCLLATCCGCFLGCFWRSDIRERNNIHGDTCSDIMAWCCCTFCSVAQMLDQAKHSQVVTAHPGAPVIMHH
eukprot:TRINITY_DN576_c0_g1_i2.p1 TRINITY_DN576_c0_g1~~TRINITY_DN576_c0_g1_i2.p1  ORF type:complete len:174 (+),score=24.59 TRINITY_DN576_c0_g1_i2:29-523(+)